MYIASVVKIVNFTTLDYWVIVMTKQTSAYNHCLKYKCLNVVSSAVCYADLGWILTLSPEKERNKVLQDLLGVNTHSGRAVKPRHLKWQRWE